METKIAKTILPPILGILSVLIILLIVDVFLYGIEILNELGSHNSLLILLYIVIPAIIIGCIIQYFLTLPFWAKFKARKKIMGLKLFPFTTLIIIFSGLAFGYVTYETPFGINGLIEETILGIAAFGIYWTCNLVILKKMENSYKL